MCANYWYEDKRNKKKQNTTIKLLRICFDRSCMWIFLKVQNWTCWFFFLFFSFQPGLYWSSPVSNGIQKVTRSQENSTISPVLRDKKTKKNFSLVPTLMLCGNLPYGRSHKASVGRTNMRYQFPRWHHKFPEVSAGFLKKWSKRKKQRFFPFLWGFTDRPEKLLPCRFHRVDSDIISAPQAHLCTALRRSSRRSRSPRRTSTTSECSVRSCTRTGNTWSSPAPRWERLREAQSAAFSNVSHTPAESQSQSSVARSTFAPPWGRKILLTTVGLVRVVPAVVHAVALPLQAHAHSVGTLEGVGVAHFAEFGRRGCGRWKKNRYKTNREVFNELAFKIRAC